MSTVQLFSERMKERALLVELCESLRRQNCELDELQEMHAKGERRAEEAHEKLIEQIEDISKANALVTEGALSRGMPSMAMLTRIRAELLRLNNLVEELERYKGLVKLCMNAQRLSSGILDASAARAICEEVDVLNAMEIPF